MGLSSLKADITFKQLLEISPVARKTLKEGMPVTRRTKKARTRVATMVQLPGKSRDVKAVEIEVIVVDKVVPNVLVDGGSGLNILSEHTMKKLGLSLTGPSPFIINMANQSPSPPLGMIEDCRIKTWGEEYIVTFHVIKMHSDKDAFPILVDRPWLRMADAIVDWEGAKPSITYGPKENRVKVYIGSLGRWVRKEIISSLDEGEEENEGEQKQETLVGAIHPVVQEAPPSIELVSLGPNLYHWSDDGEYAKWLKEYPDSVWDVMVIPHHECLRDGRNSS